MYLYQSSYDNALTEHLSLFIGIRKYSTFCIPSIAQLVERWTVAGIIVIHRSLVQIRLEGFFDKKIVSMSFVYLLIII